MILLSHCCLDVQPWNHFFIHTIACNIKFIYINLLIIKARERQNQMMEDEDGSGRAGLLFKG